MIECGWLSDRIPAVALGQAEWSPEELRHLHECLVCREEWDVVLAAGRLGERLERELGSEAVASAVLQRLRRSGEESRIRRARWSVGGLAAAAAIVITLWSGAFRSSPGTALETGSVAAGQLEIPLPELESLQATELDSVLQMMDEPNGGVANVDDPDLRDLSSDELERVLHSWEG